MASVAFLYCCFLVSRKRLLIAPFLHSLGRLGIFHASLQQRNRSSALVIPQPAGWGFFTLAYNVGAASGNPPTGRLGIFHSSLQRRAQTPAPSGIPQPAGWGSFTPAYKRRATAERLVPQIPQPAGWGSLMPAHKRRATAERLVPQIPQPAETV